VPALLGQLLIKKFVMRTTIEKLIYVVGFLLLPLMALAQQNLLYSEYRFDGLSINPAYAGNHEVLSLTGIARKQWVGIVGSPEIFSISGHKTMANDKVGLGLTVFQEKVAVSSSFQANMSYSYKIIKDDKRLSFGLLASFANYSQVLNQLENINQQDPNFQDNLQHTSFNVGTGIYFETKRYFVGLSIPQIIKNYDEPGNPSSGRQLRQYFLNSGYLFSLNRLLKLKASCLFRYDEDFPVRYDFDVSLLFNEKIWSGVGFKNKDAYYASLQLMITEKMKIAIAYDYLISDLQKVSRGSMEIAINYRFLRKVKKESYF
jgi:type IX secretion system PorP/SprF family membrane protein